jgi:hypothetical protein
LLEPKLIRLVDDDEQHFIMRMTIRFVALQLLSTEYFV